MPAKTSTVLFPLLVFLLLPVQLHAQAATSERAEPGLGLRIGWGLSTAGDVLRIGDDHGMHGSVGVELPVAAGVTIGAEGVVNSARFRDLFTLATAAVRITPSVSATAAGGTFLDNGVRGMGMLGARLRLPLEERRLSLELRRAFLRDGVTLLTLSTVF